MNKKTQSGFAHIVILTVILAVALIGTLGFVFYQNFIQKKDEAAKTNDSSKRLDTNKDDNSTQPLPSEVALTEIASDQTRGTGLSIKYPNTWTMTHIGAVDISPQSGSDADRTTITSPDGTVEVSLIVGVSGIGGTCDPADKSSVVSKLDTDTISGYMSARFVSYVIHYISDDVYYFYAGAQKSTEAVKSVKVGDSPCGFMMQDMMRNNASEPITNLTIQIDGVSNQSTNMTDVNHVLTTDNYKIAKRIIQSLYVK